jgi:hypothetical protein
MRVAARRADAVARHTELLSSAAMTARTFNRIPPRGAAVIVECAGRAEPALWMGALAVF